MFRRYSLLTLFLLVTIGALVSLKLGNTMNPSVGQRFRELITLIPVQIDDQFQEPATTEQLDRVDEVIRERNPGARLPENVKTLYTICGGQPWATSYETDLFPSFALNPIENAISDYKETCYLYDEYAKPHETKPFPNKWYDYRLFPFGYAPGTGTLYCVDIETEKIYNFNPDGGIYFLKFESIKDLLDQSIQFQSQEFGR